MADGASGAARRRLASVAAAFAGPGPAALLRAAQAASGSTYTAAAAQRAAFERAGKVKFTGLTLYIPSTDPKLTS
jgi:hypothetical protein